VRLRYATLVAAVLSGCGGDSPRSASPTAPIDTVASSVFTIHGSVVETVSGQPVSGALVEAGGSSARTDATGAFQISSTGGVLPVTITAANHVTRRTFLGPTSASVDVIETSSLWNLGFYRELVRNGAGGGRLEPLNPWTIEPRFYVNRSAESGSGREIPDSAVATVVASIQAVVPLLTGGRFAGDRIEVGTSPPDDGTAGTVVIRWDPVEIASTAGAAAGITRGVGGNASVVVLRSIEETGVIHHELGHVLGLFHPLGGLRPSLMSGSGKVVPPYFTDWDVFHARVLYARPPGNTDVDNDPAGFVAALRTDRASSLVVVCP
jgi:hypothetical protein